jgi:hypothetical protein
MSKISPSLSPNLGTSRVTQRGGAGGGGNADVVPGANPARQDLAAGTVSAQVTFVAPTGGSGSGFSFGAVLSKPSGSGASLSGTGLGPYTVSGMANDQSFAVIFTATDTGDGQIANNFGLIGVSSATITPTNFLIPNPTTSNDSITVVYGDLPFKIPNVTVVP